jgi:hypothetical protein
VVVTAVLLGWVGYHFTVRTLRLVTAVIAVAAVVLLARYGLTHPAQAPSDLAGAFTRGADEMSGILLRPVLPSGDIPAPGRIGWLVITAAFVIGYRQLEAWAHHWQAPVLDTSALRDDQQGTGGTSTPGQPRDGTVDGPRLAAELRFRLAAMEVRTPAIVPGGSRSMNGLASIAEASGVTGSGLAGAIIRILGMLWPRPSRLQLRVWVETPLADMLGAARTRVTVLLEDSRTGESVATKTLGADDLDDDLDDAATRVAGYVARHLFAKDPATPPWCYGAADGRDLAAWLLARQQRVYPRSPDDIKRSREEQISILEKAAASSRCAGIVRYELAQLYDLAGDHIAALRLHAINREQYPHFYRGRYRLGISLEMIANPEYEPPIPADTGTIDEILSILERCGLTKSAIGRGEYFAEGKLSPWLRLELLDAARKELGAIRRQLTLWRVTWTAFLHRGERAARKPFWGLRSRQGFRDGARVAELLVAVRQRLAESRGARNRMHELRPALNIVTAIASDNRAITSVLRGVPPEARGVQDPPRRKRGPAATKDRIRWLPAQRRTASWQAAYTTACLFAALAREHEVVISLERAINNPDSELDRPSDWISNDPDFTLLRSPEHCFPEFKKFLDAQERKDYPEAVVTRP